MVAMRISKTAALLFLAATTTTTTVVVVESWTSSRIAASRSRFSTTTTTSAATSALKSAANANTNYNVVLSPSDNNDAFDNFKVGNCRVHRYSRDADSMETEYVMWYHGRNKALALTAADSQQRQLPPLSTGRIGRAVSRNGLVWEKDVTGSASEDMTGVSLGLNQESWWGFDTAHVGLGSVLLPLSTPAIMSDSGVYLMYYMGGSGEETPLADYMDDDIALPDSMKDAVLQGMKMRIGVALSQDGISWGRVEGDDPSGACMVPFDKADPNQLQERDNDNINVPEELYCAWPEVVVNLAGPKSESFLMYYSTMTKDKQKSIAFAVSEDGFRWFKRGICVAPTVGTLDAKGCARCCVVKDAVFNESKLEWTEMDNAWKMYYEGVSPSDNKHRIMMAESKDGMKWTKLGLALDVGEDGAWDCKGVGSPHCVRCVLLLTCVSKISTNSHKRAMYIVYTHGQPHSLFVARRLDDGTSRMYYTGQGADGSTAIGVAKLSGPGAGWVREQATISFSTTLE
jgi:hypothetical protein